MENDRDQGQGPPRRGEGSVVHKNIWLTLYLNPTLRCWVKKNILRKWPPPVGVGLYWQCGKLGSSPSTYNPMCTTTTP